MELSNQFRVGVPIDEAWATLTDVEGIAPCLPGAQLTEIEGDEYRGQVKVKVGPITAQYKGSASFVEKDDASYRAVLDAKGRDTRGQGNASATVTVQLTPDGDGTSASIVTDLKLSGKVAQFGRGVMADVSEKLLGQFVTCLEAKLGEQQASGATAPGAGGGTAAAAASPEEDLAGAPAPSAAPAASTSTAEPGPASPNGSSGETASTSGPRRIDMPEPEPVDLLETAGAPMAKRVVPLVLVLLVVLFLLRRRRSHG
jgi:MYXO-CTERM domain-containing protein